MNKQTILNQISLELARLGVSFKLGHGADLIISQVFAEAGWGSDGRQIRYEAALTLDDKEVIARFWESTVEITAGMPGDPESESHFQSSSTLFRQVIFHRQTDGNRRENASLDLGIIARTIKREIHRVNWRFMTALSKDRVLSSPADAAGVNAQPGPPVRPSPAVVHKPAVCAGCGHVLIAGAKFCGNCGRPASGR